MILKRENNKRISAKSQLTIIGFLFVILGVCFIIFDVWSDKNIDKLENQAIEQFYEIETINIENEPTIEEITTNKESKKTKKIEYIGVLKIPKINLERGLVNPNSYLNDVDYNVEILDASDMPDTINGNVILVAHSGNARISYFKNLDKLKIGDEVIIDYKSKSYNYSVVNIYDIPRTGKAEIIRDVNVSTLTLITCRDNTKKQIVIICELKK